MSVIPVGTGNDFLKNFGDDLDKFRDAENLWDGPQFPMDAIDVNGPGGPDHRLLRHRRPGGPGRT